MFFTGRFFVRGSAAQRSPTQAPSESQIQQLNPKRKSAILNVTGWKTLADGSLNLHVDDAVVEALASLRPALEEPGEGIVYPPSHEGVPKMRKGYWYYAGTARKGDKAQPVLVRRAIVPLPGVVELFAAVSLTDTFKLVPGDSVWVEIAAQYDDKAFETALATRNLEIGLFWQRSLFFWGFIGAAFVGHAALRKSESNLSLVLACFGLVCSVAWSLVNRGSKYWQESWEAKVDRLEDKVTGPLFKVEEARQKKGWWLSARRYSVSKLTIALADYTILVWTALVAWECLRIFTPNIITAQFKLWAAGSYVAISLVVCILLIGKGRSTSRSASGR